MKGRQALIRWAIFLSVTAVLSVFFMVRMPGFEDRYGPLLLYLFVIPIGIAAWYYGSGVAFGVGVASLSIAALVFCIPQYVFVRVHDTLDLSGITILKEALGVTTQVSVTQALSEYLKGDEASLAELLDQGVPYSLLSHIWPPARNFGGAYLAYLTRPLFSTGLFLQILLLIVASPFLGVLAEGGMGGRRRLRKARERIQTLETAMQREQTTRTLGNEEAAGEANRLQSMIITISDMAREISSALQEKTVFKLLLKKTVDLLRAQQVALFRPDANGQYLVLVASIGYDPDQIRKLRVPISDEGGILGWCSKHKLFLSMDEVMMDYHKVDLAKSNQLTTLFCQPVVRSGNLILVLCVGETEKRISHRAVARLMSTLANFASIALDNAKLMEATHQQAIRDGLTGIYNHRYFQERLDEILLMARTKGKQVSCILADLDWFKRLNDTHGHQAGDEVLRRVAHVLQEIITGDDLVARYGGEEFVVVLVGKGPDETRRVAEKVRHDVEGTRVETAQKVLQVTLSLGAACYNPAKEKLIQKDVLIKQADEALYQAKKQGRNRVVLHGSGTGQKPARGA